MAKGLREFYCIDQWLLTAVLPSHLISFNEIAKAPTTAAPRDAHLHEEDKSRFEFRPIGDRLAWFVIHHASQRFNLKTHLQEEGISSVCQNHKY